MSMVVFALIAVLAQAPRLPRVDQVAWLRGCWELQTREGSIESQWLSPRASSILGVSRTIHGARLVDYEMALISERGDRLAYEAHPSNGEANLFMSVALGDRRVVFENLKPRFPTRVGYELTSPDRLLEWTEGVENGQQRRVEYPFARVACPGD